jgi:hypothetical protein
VVVAAIGGLGPVLQGVLVGLGIYAAILSGVLVAGGGFLGLVETNLRTPRRNARGRDDWRGRSSGYPSSLETSRTAPLSAERAIAA